LAENERITIVKQKARERCEAEYPGAQIHITGVAELDPEQSWPRQDDPINGIISGVPTPNQMWCVFVDVNQGERSGTINAIVVCWYAGTKHANLEKFPAEIVKDGIFAKEETISVERIDVVHPWYFGEQL
jgi:hypothetical protein